MDSVDGDGDLDFFAGNLNGKDELIFQVRCSGGSALPHGGCAVCDTFARRSEGLGDDRCVECAPHTSRDPAGSCVACPPGQMRSTGELPCTKCEKGYAQLTDGTACTACNGGTYAHINGSIMVRQSVSIPRPLDLWRVSCLLVSCHCRDISLTQRLPARSLSVLPVQLG